MRARIIKKRGQLPERSPIRPLRAQSFRPSLEARLDVGWPVATLQPATGHRHGKSPFLCPGLLIDLVLEKMASSSRSVRFPEGHLQISDISVRPKFEELGSRVRKCQRCAGVDEISFKPWSWWLGNLTQKTPECCILRIRQVQWNGWLIVSVVIGLQKVKTSMTKAGWHPDWLRT